MKKYTLRNKMFRATELVEYLMQTFDLFVTLKFPYLS